MPSDLASFCGPRQRGLSLIELMIALLLGSLLTLGVVNVFIANQESTRVQNALSRLQQYGRVAVEFLNKDVRRAGYQGCNSVNSVSEVAATAVTLQGVRVFSRPTSSTTLVPDASGSVADVVKSIARPGSDILVVDYAEFLGNELITAAFESGDGGFTLSAPAGTPAPQPQCQLSADDLVVVSNCLTSHVFRVSSATSCSGGSGDVNLVFSPADNSNPLTNASFKYLDTAEVAKMNQMIWFVADTGRDRMGADVYALYRLNADQPVSAAEEMIEGVESLQFELGQFVNGNVRLVPPTAANIDWDQVQELRYALLVQTLDPISDANDAQVYQLLSTEVGPTGTPSHGGGRFVRRVFTGAQGIRNTAYDS